MSDSVRPQRRQSPRAQLPRPWDSPGKNTGVGCHFLPQCMKMKSESEVAQSCPTLSDPMDCSLPGSSVHGSFQARVLESGAVAFFVGSASFGQLLNFAASTVSYPLLYLTGAHLAPSVKGPEQRLKKLAISCYPNLPCNGHVI